MIRLQAGEREKAQGWQVPYTAEGRSSGVTSAPILILILMVRRGALSLDSGTSMSRDRGVAKESQRPQSRETLRTFEKMHEKKTLTESLQPGEAKLKLMGKF